MINILIVEDDPMVAQINIDFCKKIDREKTITHVKSVADANDFLAEHSCDLILLDVFLPNKSGLDLMMELRNQNKYIPIILITASDENETLRKAYAYGVIDYLIKPFSAERFAIAIEKFLKYDEIAQNKRHTDQQMLDSFFRNDLHGTSQEAIKIIADSSRKYSPILPKGLSKLTLRKVYQAILTVDDWFSTEDIVKITSLSRISTKKYIQFLVDERVLREELAYQAVGRPTTIYQVDRASQQIKLFLGE